MPYPLTRWRLAFWGVTALTLSLLAGSAASPGAPVPAPVAHPARAIGFEPNAGQSDPAVRFLAHAAGGTFFFTRDGLTLVLGPVAPVDATPGSAPEPPSLAHVAAPRPPTVVRLAFVGANPLLTLDGGDPLPGRANYFLGNDPAQWYTNLPLVAEVHYASLYPGIDLLYRGDTGQLKGTYTLAPGADPARIRWRYTGATDLMVDAAGNLQLHTGAGTLTEQAPRAWQILAGRTVQVPARYAIAADGSLGFALGHYDPAHPLILDPTLTYSTYLGGNSEEQGWGVAVDSTGSAYLTGWTASSTFPRQAPYQATYGGGSYDAYVTKLNPGGSALIYSTFLGGSLTEEGMSIAVDAAGNAYVTGRTNSSNFPVLNPLQPGCGSCPTAFDSFVTKLNATGSALVYSTFLGGSDSDEANSIAVDSTNNVVITGGTYSVNFPLANALQPTFGGGIDDAFVTKINAAGSALVYSTYLGGASADYGWTVAVDGTGIAAVTGLTLSGNFPRANAFQPVYAGGGDAFVSKLTASGAAFVFSTYLGGSAVDTGEGAAMDPTGNVYVGGFTASSNFPLVTPYQPTNHGGQDGFVTKLSSGGAGLLYSTYLGGSGDDVGLGLAVNSAGEALLSGQTTSGDFPLVSPLQPTYGGNGDVFVSKLLAAGTGLGYSTYLGGSGNDYSSRLTTDATGSAYVTGWTTSSNFPLAAPYQPAYAGGQDAFLSKINDGASTPTATATSTRTPTVAATSTPTQAPTNTPTSTGTPPASTTATNTPVNTATGTPPGPSPTHTLVAGTATNTATSTLTSIATATPTATPTCAFPFTDVDPYNPFRVYILCLYCRGLVSGYADNTFRPYAPVTRSQVAKIIANSAGFLDPPVGQTFEDVPPTHSFYPFVERLASRGHISGYPCGGSGEPCVPPTNRPYFRPYNNVTRGQVAKIAANAAGFSDIPTLGTYTFGDVLPSDPFYLYIERLSRRGIINGYDCGLGATNPCTSQPETCDAVRRSYYRPCLPLTRGQTTKIAANTFFPVNCAPGSLAILTP